ncbi:AT-rich interactive domain-containing protein 5B [Crotalus adamanteus]|uniref:AT-rich interactive domain-containing protein 5B n=1 Tax=Crotalus adamanteus TaxID=8729 RepID=A0AAW1BE99_CROAD
MEPNSVQWVGSPCGLHGPYIFYKAFQLHLDGRARILSLGDFFFVRCRPEDPLCIAELQLLWEERSSRQLLSSSKLYFLPEDTPQGRRSDHGEVGAPRLSPRERRGGVAGKGGLPAGRQHPRERRWASPGTVCMPVFRKGRAGDAGLCGRGPGKAAARLDRPTKPACRPGTQHAGGCKPVSALPACLKARRFLSSRGEGGGTGGPPPFPSVELRVHLGRLERVKRLGRRARPWALALSPPRRGCKAETTKRRPGSADESARAAVGRQDRVAG